MFYPDALLWFALIFIVGKHLGGHANIEFKISSVSNVSFVFIMKVITIL